MSEERERSACVQDLRQSVEREPLFYLLPWYIYILEWAKVQLNVCFLLYIADLS